MTESDPRPSSRSIPQLEHWIDGVRAACAEAREAILDIYENDDFDVEMKADDSPLTRADLASHRILVAALELCRVGACAATIFVAVGIDLGQRVRQRLGPRRQCVEILAAFRRDFR